MAWGTPVSFVSRWMSAARLSAVLRGSLRWRRTGEGLRRRGCRDWLPGGLSSRNGRLPPCLPFSTLSLRCTDRLSSVGGLPSVRGGVPCCWLCLVVLRGDFRRSGDLLRFRLRGVVGVLCLSGGERALGLGSRWMIICRGSKASGSVCALEHVRQSAS
jgi:hypothetical protein